MSEGAAVAPMGGTPESLWCPKCDATDATENDEEARRYRKPRATCQACGHTWVLDAPEPPAAPTEPDRWHEGFGEGYALGNSEGREAERLDTQRARLLSTMAGKPAAAPLGAGPDTQQARFRIVYAYNELAHGAPSDGRVFRALEQALALLGDPLDTAEPWSPLPAPSAPQAETPEPTPRWDGSELLPPDGRVSVSVWMLRGYQEQLTALRAQLAGAPQGGPDTDGWRAHAAAWLRFQAEGPSDITDRRLIRELATELDGHDENEKPTYRALEAAYAAEREESPADLSDGESEALSFALHYLAPCRLPAATPPHGERPAHGYPDDTTRPSMATASPEGTDAVLAAEGSGEP